MSSPPAARGYVDRLLEERNGFVLECQDELLAAAGVPA